MIDYLPASPAHLRRIANRIGHWDRIECEAGGRSALDAIRASYIGSVNAWTVRLDRHPVAMVGICPISEIDGTGTPWLLGSDDVRKFPRAWVELGREVLPVMQRRFSRLENVVALGNTRAQRLLAVWGFIVGGPVVMRNGVEFIPFFWER